MSSEEATHAHHYLLYDLILSQLEYDGYERSSQCLAEEMKHVSSREPSSMATKCGGGSMATKCGGGSIAGTGGTDHLSEILLWCSGIKRRISLFQDRNNLKNKGIEDEVEREEESTSKSPHTSTDVSSSSDGISNEPCNVKSEAGETPSPTPPSSDITTFVSPCLDSMTTTINGNYSPSTSMDVSACQIMPQNLSQSPLVLSQSTANFSASKTVPSQVVTTVLSHVDMYPSPPNMMSADVVTSSTPCMLSPVSLSPPLDITPPNDTKTMDVVSVAQEMPQQLMKTNICSMLESAERLLVRDKPVIRKSRLFCRFCGKFFAQQSALLVHERIHTGEKPFRCHYCDRAFSQVSNMKSHERLHTGEKPYQCNECGKRFTQSASLRCHVRSHTGERPYACNFCHKTFTQPASLQHHIRTHTGEKPYKCVHCDKKFAQLSSLVAHKRSHLDPLLPVVCPICFHSFSKTSDLKDHMTVHQTTTSTLSFNIGEPFSLQGVSIGT